VTGMTGVTGVPRSVDQIIHDEKGKP